MPSIYSFTQNHSPFDKRPHKVEQLFSPCSKTPKIPINDITYQVPVDRVAVTPNLHCIDDNDFTFGFSGLNSVPDKFPRQSTCLKGDKPASFVHPITPTHDEPAVASSTTFDNRNIQQDIVTAIPQFKNIHQLKDTQPIRATCFHPDGEVYVVGTNSKLLQICIYPTSEELHNFNENDEPVEPNYAFRFLQLHAGSIYCTSFNGTGSLLATGSNDRSINVIKYNSTKNLPEGDEYKLTMHSGTVRDLCFLYTDMEDNNSLSSNLLISAGAGDNAVHLTDCNVMKPTHTMKGHESTIMSLHSWSETPTFVSGSLDGTVRFWDTRGGRRCTSVISTNKYGGDLKGTSEGRGDTGTPVGVVRVEPSGKLLVSGNQDGTCMLYDIRGGKIIQTFQAHQDEIRTLNFSPKSYYLLTGGYDGKVKLMDVQGDLTKKLPCVDIALLNDKVIQTAWHPTDYTFVTTSADGSANLWAMPEVGSIGS